MSAGAARPMPGESTGVGLGALQAEMMAQLRRLNSAEGEDVEVEVGRTRAVASLAGAIVDNANVLLAAAKAQDGFVQASSRLPKELTS